MKIEAIAKMEVEVTPRELGRALMTKAWELCGKPDDAGCDWVTDSGGNTYIDGLPGWKVSQNPIVSKIVDVANYLILGHELKLMKDAE